MGPRKRSSESEDSVDAGDSGKKRFDEGNILFGSSSIIKLYIFLSSQSHTAPSSTVNVLDSAMLLTHMKELLLFFSYLTN